MCIEDVARKRMKLQRDATSWNGPRKSDLFVCYDNDGQLRHKSAHYTQLT